MKSSPAKRPFSQDFSEGGKTQQHFKESCNVNNIIAHFAATGIDPHANRLANKTFGYASSRTFAEALRHTAEIQSQFNALPAVERSSFDNDPGRWLDALTTPEPTPDDIVAPEASQEASPAPPEMALIPPTEPQIDST